MVSIFASPFFYLAENQINERKKIMNQQKDTIKPTYRNELKGRIILAGYRTIKDFSKDVEVDEPQISRVISGWELPNPKLQILMANRLGITLQELGGLLQ